MRPVAILIAFCATYWVAAAVIYPNNDRILLACIFVVMTLLAVRICKG